MHCAILGCPAAKLRVLYPFTTHCSYTINPPLYMYTVSPPQLAVTVTAMM